MTQILAFNQSNHNNICNYYNVIESDFRDKPVDLPTGPVDPTKFVDVILYVHHINE